MTALRVSICATLAALALAAQPSLTTIRDTVYRADGTPFNGIATIEWRSFQTSNQTNIGFQATTVRIVSGAFYVRLAPTTTSSNNAYYQVRYNSNGQFQFSEVWSVPPSSAILRLRDVRGTLLPGGVVGGVVAGNTSSGGFEDSETPTGTVNGINNAFALSIAPSPATSLALYRNGLLLAPGLDYSLSGATITFLSGATPQTGDSLSAFYRSGPIGASGGGTTSHNLLSSAHVDSSPAAVTRGALVVGQGATPTWGGLALGAANRCLVSNGTDAVWNTCLYTGFTTGAIPFSGANGVLNQDANALLWNTTDRRMAVGSNISSRATLYVYDSRTAAVTELLVRTGAAQGSTPIQQWLANNGDSVAWVNADGGFNVRRILTSSTFTRSALSDTGTTTDPAGSAVGNGDIWFNRSTNTWKSREAGQTHPGPQILCAAGGSATTSSATVGTCTIPAGLLLAGDRLVIEAQYSRTAGSGVFIGDILLGTSTLLASATQQASDTSGGVQVSLSVSATQASWFAHIVRASGLGGSTGSAAFTAGTGVQLRFNATSVAGSHTVQLDNFTVTRYPAQSNP